MVFLVLTVVVALVGGIILGIRNKPRTTASALIAFSAAFICAVQIAAAYQRMGLRLEMMEFWTASFIAFLTLLFLGIYLGKKIPQWRQAHAFFSWLKESGD